MKLKKEFVAHSLGDDQILVSASGTFSGYVKSNKTAAFIVDLLKDDVQREEIIAAVLNKFDATREVVEKDVDKILSTLNKVGAIDD